MRHTSLLPVLVVATLLIASCGGGSGGGSFDSRDDGVDGGDLAQPPSSPPPSTPPPTIPPPTVPPAVVTAETDDYRMTLELPTPLLAEDNGVWPWTAGQPVAFRLTLTNKRTTPQSVGFASVPWHDVRVDTAAGSAIWWLVEVSMPVVTHIDFDGSETMVWEGSWPTVGQPLGEYDLVGLFDTLDIRVPKGASLRVRLE
jgi:hypothetical protein